MGEIGIVWLVQLFDFSNLASFTAFDGSLIRMQLVFDSDAVGR